jgi:hypothetical protein
MPFRVDRNFHGTITEMITPASDTSAMREVFSALPSPRPSPSFAASLVDTHNCIIKRVAP